MPRSLLALFLLITSSPALLAADLPAGVSQPLILSPGPGNPRNSEGDFIRLKSGRIFFIYTHFTGGTNDAAAADLMSRFSGDEGKTWSDKDQLVVKQFGKQNIMSVSLLRLTDGRIALFYLVKNGQDDCRVHVQFSSDEAKTWTEPKPCVPEGSGYFVMNNNRVVQLSKAKPGRIILPVAQHIWKNDKPGDHRGVETCYYSDDNGVTFRKSKSELQAPPESRSGLQEPLVYERKDGTLVMLCRTDRGSQFRSTSNDAGETWTPAEPTDIASPLSPASVARIPKTGDLLMVWNDHEKIDPKLKGRRTPLTVAVSKDDGKTWPIRKTLYADPEGWYCYTAITFAGDRVLLGHVAGQRGKSQLSTTVVTAFEVEWLYQQ